MRSGIRTLTFTSIAVAAMGVTSVLAPTQAAAQEPVTEKGRHCVVNVSDPRASVTCYDSFPVAISRATAGRVTDAPADAGKAMTDPGFEATLNAAATRSAGRPGLQAGTVIEISYENSWFGGDTFTWTANTGCADNRLGDVLYFVNNIADHSSWWNDEYGSYRNYSLCFSKHYEHAGFQGAVLGWDYPERNALGNLDDEVSSIQWS